MKSSSVEELREAEEVELRGTKDEEVEQVVGEPPGFPLVESLLGWALLFSSSTP